MAQWNPVPSCPKSILPVDEGRNFLWKNFFFNGVHQGKRNKNGVQAPPVYLEAAWRPAIEVVVHPSCISSIVRLSDLAVCLGAAFAVPFVDPEVKQVPT
jgi:hypothetical protein